MTINNCIKLITNLAVISWISYTIYVIIPQLAGTDMTVGLGMVLGLIGGSVTWLEKLKLTDVQKEREYNTKMQSLKTHSREK